MDIVQVAYHVPDIRAAALHWVDVHGGGPFFVAEHIPLNLVEFRGRPGTLDHSSAYGFSGHLMIEFVQQNCTSASVFSDHPFGLHHCAYFAASLDDELSRLMHAGVPTAMRASTAGGLSYAFAGPGRADGPAPLGHYLEIYEDQPGLRAFYRMVEAAASGWDGRRPLRNLVAPARG